MRSHPLLVGLCVALSSVLGGIACAAQPGEVGAVTVSDADGWTRASIDVAADARYDVFALANPDRLVVDVHHARLAGDFRVPGPDGVVANVRTGKPVPGDVRLVFDLTARIRPKTSLRPGADGARLVIELRDPARKPVATAAATPARAVARVRPARAEAPGPESDESADTRAQSRTTAVVAAPVHADAITATVRRDTPVVVIPAGSDDAIAASASPQPMPLASAENDEDSRSFDADDRNSMQIPGNDRRRGASKPADPSPTTLPTTGIAGTDDGQGTAVAEPERPGARTLRDVLGARLRPIVIAVDAGHGGKDTGAQGYSGTYEKNVTLATARELARQIDATPGMKAVLTRDGDYFVPLAERYRKAREAKADLFISVHCDAEPGHSATGSSVWVLSQRGVTSQAARWLADRENAADLVGGVKLSDKDDTLASVLLDLSQSATMKASEDAAERVHQALRDIGRTHKAHPEHANFVVLRSPDVPSMLVETAFITNQSEEQRLNSPAYRAKLARAILDGVESYFIATPLPGTQFAALHARGAREARVASVIPPRAVDPAPPPSRQAAPVMLATAGGDEQVHVVQQGESLRDVAGQYGVSLIRLREFNHLQGNQVRPGQALRIPARSNNG